MGALLLLQTRVWPRFFLRFDSILPLAALPPKHSHIFHPRAVRRSYMDEGSENGQARSGRRNNRQRRQSFLIALFACFEATIDSPLGSRLIPDNDRTFGER